jgi:branched-chain amino acid transport system substrate-binding protein
MSRILESVIDAETRAECARNDRCLANGEPCGRAEQSAPAGLRPDHIPLVEPTHTAMRAARPMNAKMGRSLGAVRYVVAVCGLAFSALVQAGQIVVGQVGPMSGLEANQGHAYAAGMRLLFNTVNNAGGMNGHTFTLVSKDDGGRPDDTVAATKRIIADEKPMLLAGYFGNSNVSALLSSGILEKERIALVGYRAADLRSKTPYLYNVRASLYEEINKLTGHLAIIGITRLGLFHEGGPDAAAIVAAAQDAAAKAGATIVAKGSYPPGTARVSQATSALVANAPPQAIIMVSNGAAAAAFIEQYRASGGAAQLFATSGADIEQLSKRLSEEQMQGVAIAQVTPSPYRISSRVAKELNDAIAKARNFEVPVSYAMMEGYITAKVIVEAVRRQGARPTREGMPAALDSIGNFDAGGYVISFKPAMHTGSRLVELSIVSSTGKIRQ